MKTEIRPLPEMLGRKDTKQGEWVIDTCAPVRGKPATDIVGKRMIVPVADEAVDRVIRAHEMMHAKVSPADDFVKWIERGIATEDALRVVEEVRVNFLLKKAGFDVDLLGDGSELSAGVLTAERGDWTNAVYTAVGYSICGGGKDFLTGVRRVNRAWGTTLRDIVKAVEKEFVKAYKRGDLASTEVHTATGLSPIGFAHTERIAEWVDRLAHPQKPEQDEAEDNSENSKTNEKNEETEESTKTTKKKDGKNGNGETNDKAPTDPKKVKPVEPTGRGGNVVPQWAELKIGTLPLTRRANGGLGRKRIASQMGRDPRRIGNALVDPEKRIFDQYRKGNGGIVLIDGSGSMSLTNQNILEITEASPGCTVAVYSADRDNAKDNLWILAKNGKRVDNVPERNGGNGVDAPAIRWAVSQRRHSSTPIVWITDGQVHGVSNNGGWGGYHDQLALDCVNVVLKNKVHMALNVADGVKVLKDLKNGKRPAKWFPSPWRHTYEKLNGRRLG